MSIHRPLSDPGTQSSRLGEPAGLHRDEADRPNHRGRSRAAMLSSLIVGGALAVLGISRRSLPGAAIAAGGGLLIYRGLTGRHRAQSVHVQVSYTIDRPIEQVWQFWRNLENLPRFMSHLESVRPNGPRYSFWTARAPVGSKISWDAEIVEERENQYLIWHSLPGSEVDNTGSVEFRRAPGNRGTEIHVAIDYRPPGGRITDAIATLFGGSLEQSVREDVRHFKQILEAGEIPTIEGQPHGRRSLPTRAAQAAWQEPRPRISMPQTA